MNISNSPNKCNAIQHHFNCYDFMKFSASSFFSCQLLNMNMEGHSFECSITLGAYLFEYTQPQSLHLKTRFCISPLQQVFAFEFHERQPRFHYSLETSCIRYMCFIFSWKLMQALSLSNISQQVLASLCLISRSIDRHPEKYRTHVTNI